MYVVYVLQDKNGKLYKGCTNNLNRRLAEHRRGKTRTTNRMIDIKVVYTERFRNFESARKRERYFKTAAGRRFLKDKLNKWGRSSAGYPPERTVRYGRGAPVSLKSKNMYVVYVLQDKNGKLYKGCTNNLNRRLAEHRRGKTRTTNRMIDIKVVYTERFRNFESARKRERYFKTAAGRRFLKDKLNKWGRSSAG